ncbi:Odorant receptor 39 [Cephus cinctus]|uniref:Odorant receptor n=1 Tax=Cephus cinctus TaxID=211228 RepID=A0A3L9LSV2_CEPCN|nr:odorant receptor Or1 isoform X2 [Cephus cinctus]RLZ02204.1 Odorant receptor 39 [Cephus cinctus]
MEIQNMGFYESRKKSVKPIKTNVHLQVSLSIIRYMGTWPPQGRYRNLYFVYSFLVLNIILGSFLFAQFGTIIMIWGDIEKMVSCGALLMTNIAHAFKVVVMLRHQKSIQILLDSLQDELFTRNNERFKFIAYEYTWKGIFHHVAYQSFGTVAVLCWVFTSISDLIIKHMKRLPIPLWYPFNVTNTPAFELITLQQTVGVISGCFHNVAMDTLITGLITVACCQFELLKTNIITIGSNVNHEFCKISHNEINVTNVEDNENKVWQEMRKCIAHNNKIIEFSKEIQSLFGTAIFLQFLANCVIICLTTFNMSQTTVFVPSEILGTVAYTCCMVYQIFIYCWHGNELWLQSESVLRMSFTSNWWEHNRRYKKALQMVMLRASRPVILTAGKLLKLSLETFVAILRVSYSLFTVLKTSTDH